jgi:HSP20 family protein
MTSLTRWDPFADLVAMQRDMDRLMSGMGIPARLTETRPETALVPSVDILTHGEDMLVRAEMPGVKPADIDISIEGGSLLIRGARSEEKEVEQGGYLLKETLRGHFERSLPLPEGVDPSHIKAEYRDGVLEVTLPGAALTSTTEPLKIPVTTPERELSEGHH